MKLIEYPDRELMMMDVADILASALASALRQDDRVSFCVPGGTTPGPVFEVLSGLRLDWARVTVFPGDERCVPETDPRSNARQIRRRLLGGQAAAAQFISLFSEGDDPAAAADAASGRIAACLPISVLLLGMGADMHIASLFPGAEGLDAALADAAPVVQPIRHPASGEQRLTLTGPVLAGAMATHLLLTGPEKRAALERAAHLSVAEAPVRAVLATATVHWAA